MSNSQNIPNINRDGRIYPMFSEQPGHGTSVSFGTSVCGGAWVDFSDLSKAWLNFQLCPSGSHGDVIPVSIKT